MSQKKITELSCQERLRAELKKQGCQTVKLHGNLYQPGLPDLLIGRADGMILMVEMKLVRSLSMIVSDVRKLLRPPQRRFFHDWAHCPVYVVVANPRGQVALVEGFAAPDEILVWLGYDEIASILTNTI